MPKVTVVADTETYSYQQCDENYCIAGRHAGTEHVDATGATWDSATDELLSGHDGE